MFYLTTHLNDPDQSYFNFYRLYIICFSKVLLELVLDKQYRRKEGNVLFNDALNTFYLRLYG